MELHMQLFFGLASLVLALCLLVAWAKRGKVVRWALLTLGAGLTLVSYPTLVLVLSHPRDASEEWFKREVPSALVTGVYVDEGIALYLYLLLPGEREPGSYRFSWNDETRELAKDIQGSLESEEGANGVVIPFPFMDSLEREAPLTAHPMPQPAPPLKQSPKPPIEYRSINDVSHWEMIRWVWDV